MNDIIDKINDIFIESAKNSFGVKDFNRKPKTKVNFKKPWFTKECKNARQCYRKYKRLYKKYGKNMYDGIKAKIKFMYMRIHSRVRLGFDKEKICHLSSFLYF